MRLKEGDMPRSGPDVLRVRSGGRGSTKTMVYADPRSRAPAGLCFLLVRTAAADEARLRQVSNKHHNDEPGCFAETQKWSTRTPCHTAGTGQMLAVSRRAVLGRRPVHGCLETSTSSLCLSPEPQRLDGVDANRRSLNSVSQEDAQLLKINQHLQ